MRSFSTIAAPLARALCSLLAAGCVVFATACGGDDGDGGADTTAQPGQISVDLTAQDGGRLAGARALLEYKAENRTRVLIDGFGSGERSATRARVVSGTCQDPGKLVYALAPIRDGTSESNLDVPMPDLLQSGRSIQVLAGPTDSDVIACGDLPDEAPTS